MVKKKTKNLIYWALIWPPLVLILIIHIWMIFYGLPQEQVTNHGVSNSILVGSAMLGTWLKANMR